MIAERTGRTVQDLHGGPELPDGCEMLWRDFMAMHGARGSSGFGPLRITWLDIDAYQRIMGVRFAPWEIEAMHRADTAYLASRAKPDG
jgi:hypothetical protein